MDRLTTWERLRRVNPRAWDILLAVAMFVGSAGLGAVSVPSTVQGGPVQGGPVQGPPPVPIEAHGGFDGLAIGLIAATSIALVWRRRAPITVLAIVSGLAGLSALRGYPAFIIAAPLVISAYTAAAYRERGPVLVAAVPIALAAGVAIQVGQIRLGSIETVVNLVLWPALPMLLGRIAFNRRRRIERDRERAARDAVAEERARISRELHDVVAHSMGVMVVQAGAARTVLHEDREAATAALERIEDTGRTGLAEMRRLLGILETDDEVAARMPQPGLHRLDELLETMRGAGLPVQAVVEGTPRQLPTSVDLTAYRVIQEGLTNALKHTGGANARIVLRFQDQALEVEVADDGPGPPPERIRSAGRGLIGMRERVALFGGALETGARPGGGFVVRARIPVPQTP